MVDFTKIVARTFRPVSAEHQRHQALFDGEIGINDRFVPISEDQQLVNYSYGLHLRLNHFRRLKAERDRLKKARLPSSSEDT